MFTVILHAAATKSVTALLRVSTWVLRLQFLSVLGPVVEVGFKANNADSAFLSSFMNFCSLFNFEIRYLEPGCAYGGISIKEEFFGTICFVFVVVLAAILSSRMYSHCYYRKKIKGNVRDCIYKNCAFHNFCHAFVQ